MAPMQRFRARIRLITRLTNAFPKKPTAEEAAAQLCEWLRRQDRVSQGTDLDTDLTMMLTQYVNHDAGVSRWRVEFLYGVAVGDIARLEPIVSA